MADAELENADDLLDYEDDENETTTAEAAAAEGEKKVKGSYVSIHSSGFRDFLLKAELMKAIVDCGFEHPSQVQHECIPQAIQQTDVICQAKSGMGKTAVFVISTLQQLEPVDGQVGVLILCHTRELAFQICHEYERFTTYMKNVRVGNFFGGLPVKQHREMLKDSSKCPHIIVGTPGRIKALAEENSLDLTHLRHFVVDECDKCLESIDMRADVQAVFKKFMRDPMEIYVDDESKLTLHGLVQHYVMLQEEQKNRKLNDLLDALDFNQVVIFVKSVARARELNRLLNECNFPSTTIHAGMQQAERLKVYKEFKEGAKRILVATDLVGRGIDIERVNIVLNYDMPETDEKHGNGADSYLHRVGRAGRFGTKGLAITFVSGPADSEVLNSVQERFDVSITELPDTIDQSTYMNAA